MSEEEEEVMKSTDPAFKLFGRRIPVSESSTERSSDSTTDTSEVTKFIKSSSSDLLFDKSLGSKKEIMGWDEENKFFSNAAEMGKKLNKLDGGMRHRGAMNGIEKKVGEQKLQMGVEKNDTQKRENDTQMQENDALSNESGNKSGDEVPKKPNKVLPCPRCESMDTKFCYYNNYNVNQPRHFCRNCQRYWTAGGLLRNVPVGAGRRKNKHSVGVRSLGSDCPNGNSEESVKFEVCDLQMGGYVKKGQVKQLGISGLFAKDNESLQQKSSCFSDHNGENMWNATWPRSHDSERRESGEFPSTVIDDSVCGSSNTKLTKSEMESNNTPKDESGVCCQLPNSSAGSWVNGPPPIWPMYCGNFFGNSPYIGGAMLNPESLQASAMMPWFQPCPGFPWAFPSGQMWAQASWGPAWGMPWAVAPSSANLDGSQSMLGKHTRDLSVPQSDCNGDGSIWVPKTLRIDDPEEAAKSSIWTTLGLGSKPESITSGGIFKAFQPKTENKDNTKTPVHVLCANPAASTRSASFNESS